MKAKKSLGQHFLTSTAAVYHMVTASGAKKEDTVLEIGPGKGVLTKALLATGASVIVVEKDQRMMPVLQETFAKEIKTKQLTLVAGDILTINIDKILRSVDLDAIRGASADWDQNVLNGTLREQTQASNKGVRQIYRPYKVVANIPYYITGEIMRLFLEHKHPPKSMTLLVQKEVAERIVGERRKKAKPETQKGSLVARFAKSEFRESVLSLSVKAFGTPSLVSVVKRGSFFPIPNVDSAIIHIANISRAELGMVTPEHFFVVVKTGLAHKRKILISNLKDLYAKDTLSRAFVKLSIPENVRGEDLDISTWINLTQDLSP